MQTFNAAKKHHAAVADAAEVDADAALALWNAIVGLADDAHGYAEAVRDTLPQEHAALLGTNAVAAAYAFSSHASMMTTRAAPVALRDIARGTWKAFIEQAARTEALALGFGWDLSAAWELCKDVNVAAGDMRQVERVAKLAGRMYAAIRGENAKKVPATGGEIYSVEQGNNIGRLLASESVLLTDETFELPVLERIATRRALQYAVRGTDKCSRGPIVVALDESGSMHAERNEWAKAAAVAMARVAKDERRGFAVVHFSTSCVVRHVDPAKASDVFDMIRHFLNGGTAIGRALATGLDEVESLAQKGQRGADLILVTDGVDGDTGAVERQVARAKAGSVRLWTVAIECDIPAASPLRTEAAGFLRLGAGDLTTGASAVGLAGAAR